MLVSEQSQTTNPFDLFRANIVGQEIPSCCQAWGKAWLCKSQKWQWTILVTCEKLIELGGLPRIGSLSGRKESV